MIVYKRWLSVLIVLMLLLSCVPIYADSNPYEQEVYYTLLYDYGNEYENITGGWEPHKWRGAAVELIQNKEVDHLYSYARSTSYGANPNYGYGTVNRIDLTDYKMISAYSEGYKHNAGTPWNCTVTYDWVDNALGTEDYNNIDYGVCSNVFTQPSSIIDAKKYVLGELRYYNKSTGYVIVFANTNYGYGYVRNYNVTLYKQDEWQELAVKLNLTVTDAQDLITNHSATILSNEDAVNFMVSRCTGEFMAIAVQDTTFRTALESSPYKDTVTSNEHWAKFLLQADGDFEDYAIGITPANDTPKKFFMGDSFIGRVGWKYVSGIFSSVNAEDCIWEVTKK